MTDEPLTHVHDGEWCVACVMDRAPRPSPDHVSPEFVQKLRNLEVSENTVQIAESLVDAAETQGHVGSRHWFNAACPECMRRRRSDPPEPLEDSAMNLTREQEIEIITRGLADRQPGETDKEVAGRIIDSFANSQPKYAEHIDRSAIRTHRACGGLREVLFRCAVHGNQHCDHPAPLYAEPTRRDIEAVWEHAGWAADLPRKDVPPGPPDPPRREYPEPVS